MDTEAFERELAALYGGDLRAATPLDRRRQPIAAAVQGWTTENGMALLALAAGHLGDGEAYVEVGTFKGRSLCGAAFGATRGTFYGIESFREFFMDSPGAREELMANLARFTDAGRVRVVDGDAFEVLRRPGAVAEPVGVYFYDGAHERLAHYLALGVAEQHLADEALVVVDDAGWPLVADATRRYLRRHRGYTLLFDLPADHEDDPRWHNGVWVLRYRRPAGTPRGLTWDVRWRLLVHLRVVTPTMRWAWRFFPRHPRLARIATTIVSQRSKNVPARVDGAGAVR